MAGEIKLNSVNFASESGGTITVNNGTLGSSVVFPTGVVIGMAFLADVTDENAGGSSLTATLRTLNTAIFNINCPTTITSNEFSFDETGTYIINASAPAYIAERHILRLSDDAGSTFIGVGTTEFQTASSTSQTRSFLCKDVTITASQITGGGSQRDFGFWHIVDNVQANTGLGVNNNDTTTEQYLQVQIFRLA
tara:strand:- start:233 stop:814 length:582 start_codon:yes stop_codon:yes gene_type:complete